MMRWVSSWWTTRQRGASAAEASRRVDDDDGVVAGERGLTLASRARSLQARLNALLAGALVIGVVTAMLVWYYGEALRHAGPSVTAAHAMARTAGLGPPPLGPIPTPHVDSEPPVHAGVLAARLTAAKVRVGRSAALTLTALRRSRSVPRRQPPHAAAMGAHRAALERRLSGEVFIGAPPVAAARTTAPGAQRFGALASATGGAGSRLRALLRPAVMSATQAQLLPQQRLLLAKGTFIDCTLETAIDSSLPGMTTCITSTDTFSADGTVVLLPRGTELIGQTRGAVRQGIARVFVIWSEARTPSGVVVRLDSPGTDSLGRSGLSGTVDWHFWQRFGAALLVSTLSGVIQSQVESSSGTLIVDPTASEEVLAQTLRGTQDIAPTIKVPNGQRIEVLVARDVNFTPVYELVAR